MKQRTDFRKAHHFDLQNGIAVTDVMEGRLAQQAPQPSLVVTRTSERKPFAPIQAHASNATAASTLRIPPAWLVLSKKVLRFFCCYEEPMDRQLVFCHLLFYLEDGSMQISRVLDDEQSSRPVHTVPFLKRHKMLIRMLILHDSWSLPTFV